MEYDIERLKKQFEIEQNVNYEDGFITAMVMLDVPPEIIEKVTGFSRENVEAMKRILT